MAIADSTAPPAGQKHRRKLEACANCGLPFSAVPDDNYCPRCGQENHELNVPARHLLLEFLEGTLHFDTKFFRSLQLLLFKPGFLTREFNIGHRVAFVPPIRLYVFISFIFFLLLSLQSGKQKEFFTVKEEKFGTSKSAVHVGRQESSAPIVIAMDSTTRRIVSKLKTTEQVDSFLLASKIKPHFMNRFALVQAVKLTNSSAGEFWHKFIKNVSLLMFVLMPVFGLLLHLALRRWKKHYVEFLMFSIHFHCFAFVLFSLYLIVLRFYESDAPMLVIGALLLLYLALAMHRVYPQSWLKVAFKTVLVGFLYTFTMALCFLGTLFLSFALL
jgi:hypothetical protein